MNTLQVVVGFHEPDTNRPYYFAESIQCDYFAEGLTLGEVVRNFIAGLTATVEANMEQGSMHLFLQSDFPNRRKVVQKLGSKALASQILEIEGFPFDRATFYEALPEKTDN